MSDSRLKEACEYSFARHETFAPRFGWLHKGFIAVNNDPEAFLSEDAPVTLGVGKNMVNAIRYWSSAFKLTIEHVKGGASRAHTASPTWEACWLLSENGADPYLEDPASLWLLHWWLLSPSCMAPTWWVAFNTLTSSRFSEGELAEAVTRHLRLADWSNPAPASVVRDIDCLTKMYAPRRAPKGGSPGSFEDLLDCPFRELGLLEPAAGEDRIWRFTETAKATLPTPIIAYACLDYASRHGNAERSVTLARLANEPGAPGRAFRLREPDIAAALNEVRKLHPFISVTDAIGQRSLVSHEDPRKLAWDILDAHFGNARDRVPDPAEWLANHPELASAQRRQAKKKDDPSAVAQEAM
jgi:hypothetical protein